MATVRLQRRIHRPPRHRLRAAGNGRGTRGDALSGPPPKRHRAPGPGRRGPRDATSLARPPARAERGSPPPPRAPAWHLTQVAPPKFPREGLRDKSPSRNSPELRGARPARPSARSLPERRRGPHGHMQLFVFCPARCCLRAASGCRIVSQGETLDDHPREGSGPRTPRVRSPNLPSAAGPFHQSFALSLMRNARITRPTPAES